MLQPSRRPDPLMVIGVIAVLVLAVTVACVRVEDDDCRDVGMSAVAAPARTGKPADRPAAPAAPQLSKAPAVSRAPVTKVPPAARTATATTRPHGGGHVDLDLCG